MRSHSIEIRYCRAYLAIAVRLRLSLRASRPERTLGRSRQALQRRSENFRGTPLYASFRLKLIDVEIISAEVLVLDLIRLLLQELSDHVVDRFLAPST